MTTQPATDPAAAEAPIVEPSPVEVDSGSDEKLAQLHAMYADLKAAADDATSKLKAVTDAIKLELTSRDQDARRFTLTGESGPALALTHSTSWRLDSRALKRDEPETWVRYAKQSGSWTLRVAGPAGGE